MTVGLVVALLIVVAVDFSVPRGDLVVHPVSERSVVKKKGWPPRDAPDTKVRLALVSYALPTRNDTGTGALEDVRCGFTVSVEDGRTSAALNEQGGKEPCTMGEVTNAVVETLSTWRFETVRDARPGRRWMNLSVHFEEGATTAEVDIERAALATVWPSPPFEGLHVVEPVRARVRVAPQLSPAARSMRGSFKCALTIAFDESGVPTDVVVQDCPTTLVDSLRAAAWKWRFHPPTVDGVPMSGEFELQVEFKLN